MHSNREELKYWDDILREAGLPPEPGPQRNASPLPKDQRSDFVVEKEFFEQHSDAIFEAKQQWKKIGRLLLRCSFCGHRFLGRKGQKHCATECRRRNSAKEQPDTCVSCGQIIRACEPYMLEGKKHCGWCAWCKKHR